MSISTIDTSNYTVKTVPLFQQKSFFHFPGLFCIY